MPVRTNSDAVKAVMAPGGDYDTKRAPDLTPSITVASALVDRLVAGAADLDIVVTSVQAELIERWLSAWAYCMSDRNYTSRSTEGASGSFNLATPTAGLGENPYGRVAMTLDPTGTISDIVNTSAVPIVGGYWLGTPRT